MNTLFFGIIGTVAVIFFSMDGDWSFYLQKHSIIIVLGGSCTILLFTTPAKILRNLYYSIKDLFDPHYELKDHKKELVQLAENKRLTSPSQNELVNYAIELWEQGINADLFVVLLSQMKDDLILEKQDAVHSLKNMAKYPPALGMTGTVMGMVALFAQLDGQKSNIGQNLALAMTATFFGLIVANGIVSPLSDRLAVNQVYYQRYFTNIYQMLLLINADEPVVLISHEVDKRAAG